MVNQWSFFEQINRLIPQNCPLCADAAPANALCTGCHTDLPWNQTACRRCAIPLETGALCADCLRHPPLQQRSIAPLRYEFPVDQLIAGLKYHGQLAHASLLGHFLLKQVLHNKLPRPDLVLPVPLHPRRLRERGYNQALELSRPLLRHWKISAETQLIYRQRHTFSQMKLGAAARARNPQGAFQLNPSRLAALGKIQHVMIIDDVMTTGATLQAISTLLQEAGIPFISFGVVARTP